MLPSPVFTNFDHSLLGTLCNPLYFVTGTPTFTVNRPGDPPPAPGPPAAGPCIRTGRITAGSDRTMPSEPHALISTPVAIPIPERRGTERLSLRAAIFSIGVLSLAAWAVIIALALALF
jgi:hypothetical protein